MQKRIKASSYGESIFDIVYLCMVLCFGVYYLIQGKQQDSSALVLYGTMALILGIGDAFHLVPRILFHISAEQTKWNPYLGVGKMLTSITMTIFYILLYYIWSVLYPSFHLPIAFTIFIWMVAILRMILCILPQNHWIQNEDNGKWPLYRNLPFILLGVILIVLYTISALHSPDGFKYMPIAITFSFLCYIPVSLYATQKPILGMLMLPKTLMYLWIIMMGLQLL